MDHIMRAEYIQSPSRYFALLQDERYHVKDVLIIHEDLICVTYTVRKSESSKETKVKTPKAVPPKWVVIPPPTTTTTTPAATMTRKTQKEEEVVVVVSKKKKKTPTKKTLVNPMDTPATVPPKQKKQKLEEKVPVKTSPKKVSKSISPKSVSPKSVSPKSVSPKSTCLKSTLPKGTLPKGTLPKGTPPKGTPTTKKTKKKKEAPITTTKAADPQSVKKQMTSDVLWNNDQQTVDVSPDKLASPASPDATPHDELPPDLQDLYDLLPMLSPEMPPSTVPTTDAKQTTTTTTVSGETSADTSAHSGLMTTDPMMTSVMAPETTSSEMTTSEMMPPEDYPDIPMFNDENHFHPGQMDFLRCSTCNPHDHLNWW
ncbi:uncharacterized protein DDB_G0290587-like [Haliotis asinina]|uniref:uncharacterized protein DDB_G0290587-like n=1 Tax=Haliotis asinina TaxID=109174 RepID=UPI003531822E